MVLFNRRSYAHGLLVSFRTPFFCLSFSFLYFFFWVRRTDFLITHGIIFQRLKLGMGSRKILKSNHLIKVCFFFSPYLLQIVVYSTNPQVPNWLLNIFSQNLFLLVKVKIPFFFFFYFQSKMLHYTWYWVLLSNLITCKGYLSLPSESGHDHDGNST